jgi:hypothetical protein
LPEEERHPLTPPANHAPTAGNTGGFIPLPHPIKQVIKDGIVASAVAVWCFVRPWSHLLFDRDRYFNKLPVTRVELLALAANILCLAVMIWLGIGVWRRSRSRILPVVLDLLFLGLLLFPVDYIRVQFLNLAVGGVGGFFRHLETIPLLVALLLLLFWKHRLVARSVALVISFTFPAALWTMAKIVLLLLNVVQLQQCTFAPPPPPLFPTQEGRPRVLWIIFDETDYRLAFEKRPAGTVLPEFDRLRDESLCAEQAFPPGDSTIISLPALLTGHRLSAVEHDDCDLALTLADTGATIDWSASPSVFSKAHESGVNTALVGWYHPYQRLMGGSLNYCSWYAMPGFETARAATFAGSMQEQIASLVGRIHTRQLFINICRDSLKDSVSVATNPAYGFIFLHLPPPHVPGVYLPARNEFTRLGVDLPDGYFNNLMLADHELGVLRHEMETAGQWDKSWVILSSDHSWRKSAAYVGLRDFRVPFLVKCPGAGESIPYTRQFNTVLTDDLVLAILRGQVTNQAGVAALLDRGKPDMPVPRTGEGSE